MARSDRTDKMPWRENVRAALGTQLWFRREDGIEMYTPRGSRVGVVRV